MYSGAGEATTKDKYKNFPEDVDWIDFAQDLEGVYTIKVIRQHTEKLRIYNCVKNTLENQLYKLYTDEVLPTLQNKCHLPILIPKSYLDGTGA